MRVRVRGCRGTIATSGADTMRYGGNTSCVEVRLASARVLILDAGTGIRELGAELAAEGVRRIDLLLTHLHVDHLEGLGTFAPIWSPDVELHVWGPSSPVASLAERVATYFSPPLFPVTLSEAPARMEFHDASGHEWELDGARSAAGAGVHPRAAGGARSGAPAGGSACWCVRSRSMRLTLSAASAAPSSRIPVPASKISTRPLARRTSPHDVFPP